MLAVALAWIGGLLSKCTEFAGSKADTRSERDFWAVLQTLADVGVIQGGAFLLIATLTLWLMHNAGNHERGRIVPLFLFTLILLSLLGVFSVNISLGKH
jgi:hypothetical protein